MAKIYEDTKGNTFATQREAALSNTSLGTNPNTPNNAITSAALTPKAPLVLPTPTQPTYGGIESDIAGAVAAQKSASQQLADEAKTSSESSLSAYMKALSDSGSISSSVDRTAQDEARKKTDLYTSQIEQEALATRRKIQALEKNPQGLFGGGLQDEITRISRESLSKQADLAILQSAANRDYETAASIADRQVALKMEQSKANLEALRFFYDQNKSNFDKQDQRAYSEKIQQEERLYNKQEKEETLKAELVKNASVNGAPSSVLRSIMNAKDSIEAYGIAGNYGLTIDDKIKRAQLAKINQAKVETPESTDMDKDSDFKKLKGNAELKNKLQAYQKLVEQYGAQRKGRPNAGILDNAYQEVLQAYRASKDLGALQGADLSLVDDAIKRATFEKTGLGKVINVPLLGIPSAIKKGVTKRGAEASINEAFNSIDRATNQLSKTIESKNPTWVTTPYFQSVVGQSNGYSVEVDANGNVVIPGETNDEDFWK